MRKDGKKRKRISPFGSALCLCGICANLSASPHVDPPEITAKRQAVNAHIAGLYATFGDNALPEICKALEENIRDDLYVGIAVGTLARASANPLEEGNAEVLAVMRKVADTYSGQPLSGGAAGYLMRKGDASDLDRVPHTGAG